MNSAKSMFMNDFQRKKQEEKKRIERIRKSKLISKEDYNEGQKAAALRVKKIMMRQQTVNVKRNRNMSDSEYDSEYDSETESEYTLKKE